MQVQPHILVTGFPGFLASQLIPRLAAHRTGSRTYTCLVEARFVGPARERADQIAADCGCEVRVVAGDITRPDLDLGSAYDEVAATCTEIFHLAAVYDLAVPLDVATAVNVDGTRHVLDFGRACPGLERFHHISTCYVSGRYPGVFHETDLDLGQTFANHYESTKFVSEVLVQEAAASGLPTTVYRPAIVTGDSETGEAQKMDGPYFFIQWLLCQPRIAFLPAFRGSRSTTMNIVPSDYVTRAIAYLSSVRDRPLSVYSLSDPSPLSIPELTGLLAEATHRRVIPVPATRPLARAFMRTACRLIPSLNIPAEATDYLSHPTQYDCSRAVSDLTNSGIACPPFSDYVGRLVRFVERSMDSVA